MPVQSVQLRVAVLGRVARGIAVEKYGVVGVIADSRRILDNVVCPWLPISQERSKERASRVVLDVDLDPKRLPVRLIDQLGVLTPEVSGRRRVLELQPLAVLRPNVIGTFYPAVVIRSEEHTSELQSLNNLV